MKLTTFLIILSLTQVSAGTYAQKLSINVKNASLTMVINSIKAQSKFLFIYDQKTIQQVPRLTIDLKDKNIEEVLNVAFKDTKLSYTVDGRYVKISEKEETIVEATSDFIKSFFKDIDVRGRVVDSLGNPIKGAVIKIKGKAASTLTNDDGYFSLKNIDDNAVIIVSHLGFETKEITAVADLGTINLFSNSSQLNEVAIISTGYQIVDGKKVTGSFTIIDNKTFNRTVSPDILSRLKGITNGLLFDPAVGNSAGISIRGRSTIFSETKPLIVVDNFPFEGDINTLNPNDIENVTLLKDAAAASIWGARAGNGVLVITTKKGSLNKPANVNLNANFTIGAKPDLFYLPQLTSSEFIDVERFLFDKGAYTAPLSNDWSLISPVISLLNKAKIDPTFSAEAEKQIDQMKFFDIRNQLDKYFYRNSSRQQYHIDINGGGKKQSYYFAAGFDKNLPNDVSTSEQRITLKTSNIYVVLEDKLTLSTDINFSRSKTTRANSRGYSPLLPYEQIASSEGNALATLRQSGLRSAYTDTAGAGDLLDWKYRPLDELRNGYSRQSVDLTDYRVNLGMDYKFNKELSASLQYQYYGATNNIANNDSRESFYTRDLINRYSSIATDTRMVTRPIPLGDVYSPTYSTSHFNYGRVQVKYNDFFGDKHELSTLVGSEIRDESVKTATNTLYGYNPETGLSSPVDLNNQYKYYYNFASSLIDGRSINGGTTDRYISYYGNASYTYDGRYIASVSFRKDESNLFGVASNQKGVPLWSAGIAWNIERENFFKIDWLSSLQLKATYGYNGNVNKSVSAFLTSRSDGPNLYNSLGSIIVNPPNDNLIWERVKNINTGLYFTTRNNRFSGSIEYYLKNGIDLIGSSEIAPQTGITVFTGNTASTKTKGLDIQINSAILTNLFKWNVTGIFNFNKGKITEYKFKQGANISLATGAVLTPMVDYPINSVFGLKWAGLDSTGNPQGYIDGNVSTDYGSILNSTDRTQLDFFGSRTPVTFGGLRNTFSYKMIEMSFNITYKLGYYFRSNSLNYGSLLNFGAPPSYNQADYSLRWQNPGDENKTNVPALIYPNDPLRSGFYDYSSVLIEKADHIRLQDIQLNVNLTDKNFKRLPFSNLNIYCYVTNLGIIWRKNNKGLDPDYLSSFPNPRTIAIGLKTNL